MTFVEMMNDALSLMVECIHMVEYQSEAEKKAEKEAAEEWERREKETFGLDVVN